MDKRVVLADNVELEDGSCPERLENEKFSFLKFRSKTVTITPVMREILEAVKTPRVVEDVLKEVCEHNQCSVENIGGAVVTFLNKMMKLGVVAIEGDKKKKSTAFLDNWEETKTFREFTLLELIKKKGEAYLFKCCKTQEPDVFYTLKILLNKKSPADFIREINILNSIPPHANIRQYVYFSPVDEEYPYLLLEYIDGKSLSDPVIKNETRLLDKYKIGQEILMAIDHLHRNNYLHGDIHASNFLINADYGVHLIDLGMSHRVGEDAAHGGVASYMAPERLPNHNLNFSKGPGDFRSEVFQLGICLYLLLAGTHPFKAFLLRELADAIQNEPPLPITQTKLGEPIPESVTNVVYKSLEKNPNNRYQAVSEMLLAWNNVTPILTCDEHV